MSWYVYRLGWNAVKFGAHQDRQSQRRNFMREFLIPTSDGLISMTINLLVTFFSTRLDFCRDEFVMEYATCTKKSDSFVGYLRRCFNYKGQRGRKGDT
jgi:hypothetical protein